MLGNVAAAAMRHKRFTFLLAGVAFVLSAIVGAPATEKLPNGGFRDPGAESSRAAQLLADRFDAGEFNYALLVDASGDVDTPAVTAEGTELTRRLAERPGVGRVVSYWPSRATTLRSEDGTQALVLAHLTGGEDTAMRTARELEPLLTGERGPLSVKAGGESVVNYQGSDRIKSDLAKAEAVAIPITLVVLVLFFGNLVAATLPLVVASLSILGSVAVLRLLAAVTDVSIFSLNLATALGLGLAIDYTLFIVNRYREELRAGNDYPQAIRRTMASAGRTVVFSSVTVLVSLAALLIFPLYFLQSFAYAGIAVTALTALATVTLLPAVLAALGPRIDSLSVRPLLRRVGLAREAKRAETDGFWHQLALLVMRRPLRVALVAVAILLLLGTPFSKASFGLPDDRVLPSDLTAAQVGDAVRNDFADSAFDTLQIVLPEASADPTSVSGYAERVSHVPGVARVDTFTGSYAHGNQIAAADPAASRFQGNEGAWMQVTTDVEAFSDAGKEMVADIRAEAAPGGRALVSGPAAAYADTLASLFGMLPWAVLLIMLTTGFLLFLFTGGLLVPVKALVLNALSLSATFGAMVFVFQWGNLQALTGEFTLTGHLDVTMPILMFCVLFGLSMDYEVFLLSRIKEEYDRTGDNRAAVALGLERTGRIVTAAAVLLAIVFVALITSGITHVKMLGLGTALAILLDATVVRGLLLPAFMRLAGRLNWWAPDLLRRAHHRIGIKHHALATPAPPAPSADPALAGELADRAGR